MASDRSLLERQMERVELRSFPLEGFNRRRERKQRNRRMGTAVVVLAVAAAAIGGLTRAFTRSVLPAGDPRRAFVGTWEATDQDGSSLTMEIRATRDDALEILVRDDAAAVCSGTPSTMTGTGRLSGTDELVIPTPVLTCQDGSEPVALSGPPLEEQLRNLTFIHDREADTLTDNFDVVWGRGKAPQLVPETEVARGVYEGTPWHLSILKNSVYLRGYLGDEIFAGYS